MSEFRARAMLRYRRKVVFDKNNWHESWNPTSDSPIFDELLNGYREFHPGFLQPIQTNLRKLPLGPSRHSR